MSAAHEIHLQMELETKRAQTKSIELECEKERTKQLELKLRCEEARVKQVVLTLERDKLALEMRKLAIAPPQHSGATVSATNCNNEEDNRDDNEKDQGECEEEENSESEDMGLFESDNEVEVVNPPIEDGFLLVKTPTGKQIVVDREYVDVTMRVSDLKAVLETLGGGLAQNMRLIYAARQLEDEETLEHYGIGMGATIHLLHRLLGC